MADPYVYHLRTGTRIGVPMGGTEHALTVEGARALRDGLSAAIAEATGAPEARDAEIARLRTRLTLAEAVCVAADTLPRYCRPARLGVPLLQWQAHVLEGK